MILLKDTVRAREFPFVIAALIGATIPVFLIELRLPPEALEAFVWMLGVVPARLLASPLPGEWLALITSQFLHGGWLLFPPARVVGIVPIFLIPWFVELPAVVWFGAWFILQLLNGVFEIVAGARSLGGVAWWAHVGGFAVGLLLTWPLRRPAPVYHADQYWP